jgi:hypothetical protein
MGNYGDLLAAVAKEFAADIKRLAKAALQPDWLKREAMPEEVADFVQGAVNGHATGLDLVTAKAERTVRGRLGHGR